MSFASPREGAGGRGTSPPAAHEHTVDAEAYPEIGLVAAT